MLNVRNAVFAALVTLTLSSCFEAVVGEGRLVYDKNELQILRFSLFNQHEGADNLKKSWKGDWLFRRERLQLIDRELLEIQPDILLLGEVMARFDNPLESDRSILLAGALKGYDWRQETIETYEDAGESEFLAVAVSPPLKSEQLRKLWRWKEGALLLQDISSDAQPLYSFVFQSWSPLSDDALELIVNTIDDFIKTQHLCRKRVLIAGNFRTTHKKSLSERLEAAEFKDSARGFCNVEVECYTETTRNELFMTLKGEEQPSRNEMIFVHRTALVSRSGPSFLDSKTIPTNYYRSYGLQSLWPGLHFGWLSTVRLAMCE